MDSILLVTATCLLDLPSSIVSITSSGLQTNLSVQPLKRTKKKHNVRFVEDHWPTPTGFTRSLTCDRRLSLTLT